MKDDDQDPVFVITRRRDDVLNDERLMRDGVMSTIDDGINTMTDARHQLDLLH